MLERFSIRHSINNLRTFPYVKQLEDEGQLADPRRLVRHLHRRALGDERLDRRLSYRPRTVSTALDHAWRAAGRPPPCPHPLPNSRSHRYKISGALASFGAPSVNFTASNPIRS